MSYQLTSFTNNHYYLILKMIKGNIKWSIFCIYNRLELNNIFGLKWMQNITKGNIVATGFITPIRVLQSSMPTITCFSIPISLLNPLYKRDVPFAHNAHSLSSKLSFHVMSSIFKVWCTCKNVFEGLNISGYLLKIWMGLNFVILQHLFMRTPFQDYIHFILSNQFNFYNW